ncbi:MAG: bifunctional nuclease domain-containing protein [Bacteroidaceae bacterium]|jgi:bifunctional DNase/RNase
MEQHEHCVEIQVWGVVESNKSSNAYALILGEKEGTRHLPVIIGKAEAQYILIARQQIFTPRPLTHDLFLKVLSAVGWSLEYVEIYKENEGVFYAYLALRQGADSEDFYHMDARTSDAIAIALKAQKPIFVKEEILDRLGVTREDVERGNLESAFRRGVSCEQSEEELEEEMKKATEEEDYERAARLRDRISELRRMKGEAEQPQ